MHDRARSDINTLHFGEAREAADILNTKENVTIDDLTSALINALKRIHVLEHADEKP